MRVNSREKLAVTVLSLFMATVQVGPLPEQAPLPVHPVKI